MARIRHFPYLRATPASVEQVSWYWQQADGRWINLPSELLDWDPATAVQVRTLTKIDIARLRDECELSEDSVVRTALTWHSSGTGLRGNGSSEDLPLNGDSREVLLQTDIRGEDLAQALNLELGLILLRPGSQSGRLAARRPGSNLWSQPRRLVLEGRASRFPVELKDFGQTGWLQPAAGWYLDWAYDDLEAPLLADLRLFVNSSNKAVKDAVTGSGDPRQDGAIQQAIYFDVARTLIEGALDNDRFVAAPERFEDGTVGAAVRRLIATLFSGQDVAVVAENYRRNRFRFEVDLQHRLRVFETLS